MPTVLQAVHERLEGSEDLWARGDNDVCRVWLEVQPAQPSLLCLELGQPLLHRLDGR